MPDELPVFRYHPDPIRTGSVKPDGRPCACCGMSRGYIYSATVYGRYAPRNSICPWCIASGKAASKFDCFFSVEDPLTDAGVARGIVIEVTRRTPGYSSWQQEEWQACCDDACEFHGQAVKQDLIVLRDAPLKAVLKQWHVTQKWWDMFIDDDYEPDAMDFAVFKFVCRHCQNPRFALDPK